MKRKKTPSEPTPETVIRARRIRLSEKKSVSSFLTKLVILVAALVVLFTVLFGVTPMKSNDMKPSLNAGDLLLYYRLKDSYLSGDVVVYTVDGEEHVGRVVAVGGDEVEVTEESTLKINGSTMIETDVYYPTPRYGDEVAYPVSLNDGEYFILCDFRDGGKDSRYFGTVPSDRICGQVISAVRRSQL